MIFIGFFILLTTVTAFKVGSKFNLNSALAKVAVTGTLIFSSLELTLPIQNAMAATKQVYLAEPTQEFKDEEKRTSALRKEQIEIRKQWDSIVDEIKASDSPATTENALIKLKTLLRKIDTLPIGVKKLDLVKTCRAKKFEGNKMYIVKYVFYMCSNMFKHAYNIYIYIPLT